MGFNPRLAPYSITLTQDNVFEVASATVDIDWFRFPFAGEILAAYAAVSTNIATDTTTALTTVAIAKSLAGTGAYQVAASRVVTAGGAGASTWDNTTQYTLTNNTVLASVQFAAGDWVMVRRVMVHTSGALRGLALQMDYVLGYESGTTVNAGTGPAS